MFELSSKSKEGSVIKFTRRAETDAGRSALAGARVCVRDGGPSHKSRVMCRHRPFVVFMLEQLLVLRVFAA